MTSSSSSDSSIIYSKLPTHSDCLVGFATVKGYAAMRNTKHGSWYIQALVRVRMLREFVELLSGVSGQLA